MNLEGRNHYRRRSGESAGHEGRQQYDVCSARIRVERGRIHISFRDAESLEVRDKARPTQRCDADIQGGKVGPVEKQRQHADPHETRNDYARAETKADYLECGTKP